MIFLTDLIDELTLNEITDREGIENYLRDNDIQYIIGNDEGKFPAEELDIDELIEYIREI